jgi:hypothetical protein
MLLVITQEKRQNYPLLSSSKAVLFEYAEEQKRYQTMGGTLNENDGT